MTELPQIGVCGRNVNAMCEFFGRGCNTLSFAAFVYGGRGDCYSNFVNAAANEGIRLCFKPYRLKTKMLSDDEARG